MSARIGRHRQRPSLRPARGRPPAAVLALLAVLAGAAAALPGAPAAAATTGAPVLLRVRCAKACAGPVAVRPGGALRLVGRRFRAGAQVVFRVAGPGARRSVRARVLSARRLRVAVPPDAVTGRIYVRDRSGRRSRARGPVRIAAARLRAAPNRAATGTAFDGSGMWIWQLSRSNAGDPASIAAQAHAYGISTVFVKSADGATDWAQFSPALVTQLRAAGLHVCAWQFVYGVQPEAEAALGAAAVRDGADCLVVDAESQYQGRYAQAQRYMATLRLAVGPDYPVGLTSFPYVDFHRSLPYSVFLGPGGAQFDLPQIYWKAIGGGVDAVVDHSYRFNRPYGRPIVPIGQLYDAPPASDVVRFRQLVAAEGSAGLSWWSWQAAAPAAWAALLAVPPVPLVPPPPPEWAAIARGARGDLVILAQELLAGGGAAVPVTGFFGPITQQAVQQLQAAAALPVTGVIDTATWAVLRRNAPAPVDWTAPAAAGAAAAGTARARHRSLRG